MYICKITVSALYVPVMCKSLLPTAYSLHSLSLLVPAAIVIYVVFFLLCCNRAFVSLSICSTRSLDSGSSAIIVIIPCHFAFRILIYFSVRFLLIRSQVYYQPYFMLYGEVFADDIDPPCGEEPHQKPCPTGKFI